MKTLFAGCLAALVAASLIRMATLPDAITDKPIIYWVTDNNPVRDMQVRIFHAWLEKQRVEHADRAMAEWLQKNPDATEDQIETQRAAFAREVPDVVLQVDANNSGATKVVVQGVARMGADVIELYPANGQGMYFDQVGLLDDLTQHAQDMGFGPDATYPALKNDLFAHGKQVCFPANVTSDALWVNETLFKKLGMEPPPQRWTFDQFEDIGREFVKRANEGRSRIDRFFTVSVDAGSLMRSAGVDHYNETLTGTGYDRDEFVDTVTRYRRWIHEYRLIPSEADRSSANVESSGYGGLTTALFAEERVGMFHLGRYAFIALRRLNHYKDLELGISEVPHLRFPNAPLIARAASVYVGSKHIDAARWFMKYLASEDYNQSIIDSADSLPPNPRFAHTESYLHPTEYPQEARVNAEFLRLVEEVGITLTHSPFLLTNEMQRITGAAVAAVTADPPRYTPAEARKNAVREADFAIRRTLKDDPSLEEAYRQGVENQKKIDALRAAGQKIPASLIANAYYLQYYRAIGQLDEGN